LPEEKTLWKGHLSKDWRENGVAVGWMESP
jgi:hypothetical protein